MNKYEELQSKHRELINSFPFGFAFSNKQFEEAKVKMNVTNNNELLSISNGGFIRKTDSDKYEQLLYMVDRESKEAMKDDEYLYQGFLYELGNHEFCITYDPTDTLNCFSLTLEDVEADPRILDIFIRARKEYLEYYK